MSRLHSIAAIGLLAAAGDAATVRRLHAGFDLESDYPRPRQPAMQTDSLLPVPPKAKGKRARRRERAKAKAVRNHLLEKQHG